MNKIKKFEDLDVWQKSAELAVQFFKLTDLDKFKNKFGLKDQIQRAVISISSNIAEGFESGNNKNFIRYLTYSKASCGELRSQLYIIYKLDIVKENTFSKLSEELIVLSRKISAFINYLKKYEKEKIENS